MIRETKIEQTRPGFLRAKDKCMFTGEEYATAEFPEEAYEAWVKGAHIQDALPMLSADDREFLLTRISPNAFDETFGEDDDDDSLIGQEDF